MTSMNPEILCFVGRLPRRRSTRYVRPAICEVLAEHSYLTWRFADDMPSGSDGIVRPYGIRGYLETGFCDVFGAPSAGSVCVICLSFPSFGYCYCVDSAAFDQQWASWTYGTSGRLPGAGSTVHE